MRVQLKAKIPAEQAKARFARSIVAIEEGITLTKFTEAIGYTGGDVRSLRKAISDNGLRTIAFNKRQYILKADAEKLLNAILG
jgi:ATP-dependent protease HslVU (ClpYQ) ATPase subunit